MIMSAPTASRGSSISQHLRAIKETLRDLISDAKYVWDRETNYARGLKSDVTRAATTQDKAEAEALEQDVFEIYHLIRSWRNSLAPINQIPPEILTHLPDFWDERYKYQDAIGLTHVCRSWRMIFVSQPSLWINFDCLDADKTRIYLERSKSSPISLTLRRKHHLAPCDPFLQIVSHAIERLKFLTIRVVSGVLQDITAQISLPAPLLEYLSIDADDVYRLEKNTLERRPVLTPTIFNGDLSSLRELRLEFVLTELPWRNMVNLVSFTLVRTPPGEVLVGHLLDFFESAPRLREVKLTSATPTSGAQDGRLVSLGCLKRMTIIGSEPPSLLLDHLLIPVGATLTTEGNFVGPLIERHLPRSLENLRNLSEFTEIHLYAGKRPRPHLQFSGLNGQVTMIPAADQIESIHLVIEALAQINTSGAERLEIEYGDPSFTDLSHETFLPMKRLRTITLSHCRNLYILIDALRPRAKSEDVICPELEELVLVPCPGREELDINWVARMAAVRASRGVKLRSIRIVSHDGALKTKALKLKKHVLRVKCGPDVGEASDDSGEEN